MPTCWLLPAVIFLMAAWGGGRASAADLEIGGEVAELLAPGQVAFFGLALEEPSYVWLECAQRGIDVALRLRDGAGREVDAVDILRRLSGSEPPTKRSPRGRASWGGWCSSRPGR